MTISPKLLATTAGLALLATLPAAASTVPPTAALLTNGTLSFNSATGLTLLGDLTAEYRQPVGSPRPYIFSTSLDLGPLTVQPSLTITTPALQLTQGTPQTCTTLPFVGTVCVGPFPGITLPSVTFDLSPVVPLLAQTNVFQGSVTSAPLPLGDVLGFDYGSLLFGTPLSFGSILQDQFETGATTVNVSGPLGPFDATYSYNGELQPGNEVILADYRLDITGPGYLAEVEQWALGLFNDNADILTGFAFDLLIASQPCQSDALPFPLSGDLLAACEDLIAGIDPSELGLVVNSFGTVTGGFSASKAITPVPVPAALPLLAGGIAVFGLMGLRRRRRAA